MTSKYYFKIKMNNCREVAKNEDCWPRGRGAREEKGKIYNSNGKFTVARFS